MSTLTLLHSPYNDASRVFLADWADAGPVISDHFQAVAACPAFQGYPCIVAMSDAGDVLGTLYNPPDLTAVQTWAAQVEANAAPSQATQAVTS